MASPEPRAVSPISSWYLAVGLAAVVAASTWCVLAVGATQPETPFTHFNRGRIAAFEARATAHSARRVIVLGSSALKYATRDEDDLAAGIGRAAGDPVATLRIASNWGTFYDFVPLARDILRAKPDLVVMESEMLAADRPPGRRFLLWLRELRSGLGVDDPAVATAMTEAEVQFGYPCWQRHRLPDHKLLLEMRSDWVTVRPDGPGPRAARDLAEKLLASGARVALVVVPRRPDYELESRATREAAMQGPQGRALAGKIDIWEFPRIESGLYCDLTHVTPPGRARFSDWFESAAARALAVRPR